MKIAIASGKGGTGKTTISTNLVTTLAINGQDVQYIDCDAEEPNGHIFLKPSIEQSEDVTVGVPHVNLDACTGCGKCADLCQYSSIICLKDKPLLFEELCHSCGGCMEICPQKAITETNRKIGEAEYGKAKDVGFYHGRLDIGAIQTPAIIKHLKKKMSDTAITVIDAPPGTSCPVIEAIKDTDFVLLVTEPTPFGLNDLKLAVGMVEEMGIAFAVAINRCDGGDDSVVEYCKESNIEIMLQIPEERKIAESYSKGVMIVEALPHYKDSFLDLYNRIEKAVTKR
ncbi:MAG: P-loop NTPase [Sedimentisphaeraceae bacterium JB056]